MSGLGRRSNYRKHLTDAVLHNLPEPDESLGQRIARVVGTRGGNTFDVVVASSSQTSEKVDGGVVDEACQSSDKPDAVQTSTSNGSNNVDTQQLTKEHPPIYTMRTPQLAFLPTKFKKLIWIKRNDFVIVECGDEEDEDRHLKIEKDSSSGGGGGFRYAITHILYKDQVKHIKSKGLWPSDPFFAEDDHVSSVSFMGGTPTTSVQQHDTSDTHPKSSGGGDDDDDSLEENNDGGTYDDNGIVFDDPLGDELMLNTNRISKLHVEDSSSEDDSD